MKNWRRNAALLLTASVLLSGNWQSCVIAQELPVIKEEFLTEDASVSAEYEAGEDIFAETGEDVFAEETGDILVEAAVPEGFAETDISADLIEDSGDLMTAEDMTWDMTPVTEAAGEWAETEGMQEVETDFAEAAEVFPDLEDEFTEPAEEDPWMSEDIADYEADDLTIAEIYTEAEETVQTETERETETEELLTELEAAEEETEAEATEYAPEFGAAPETGIINDYLTFTTATLMPDNKLGVPKYDTTAFNISINMSGIINDGIIPGLTEAAVDAMDGNSVYWQLQPTGYWPMTRDTSVTDHKSFVYKTSYKLALDKTASGSPVQICVKYPKTGGVKYYSSQFKVVLGGQCGAKAYWEYDPASKSLKITGTGAMADYSSETEQPWAEWQTEIKDLSVGTGITRLGNYAFAKCTLIESVTWPNTVTDIGEYCFYQCSGLTTLPSSSMHAKNLGQRAFSGCQNLTGTANFNGAEAVGIQAFSNCPKLDGISLLSANLAFIGSYAFMKDENARISVRSGTGGSAYLRSNNFTGMQQVASWKVREFKIHTAGVQASAIADQPYTGAAIEPKPEVKDNEYVMTEGVDYTIVYTDNKEVGTASFRIEGVGGGEYYGASSTFHFNIIPSDLSTAVIADLKDLTYTGAAVMPAPEVKLGSVILAEGTDYTLSYKDNINAGTATVTVTGTGNYMGTVSKTFRINPADISSAVVEGLEDQIYNGTASTPAPVVKTGETVLAADTDYTVAYQNNTGVGTATVTITGKGNYTGIVTKTFLIKQREKVPSPLPADAASIENPLPVDEVETNITEMKTDDDIKGSSYSLLRMKAVARTGSIKLSWKKVAGAKQYVVYGSKCGKNKKYRKIAEVTGKQLILKKVNGKKLKKGTYYKFLVMAVSDQDVLAVSKTIHVAHKGGKYGNAVKVTLDKKKISLKPKKKATITPYVRVGSLTVKNHRAVAFESSDIRVATVTKKGKIKAKAAGTCYVYAYAQNGKYARVKVTVK